jgi:hypothetical protein
MVRIPYPKGNPVGCQYALLWELSKLALRDGSPVRKATDTRNDEPSNDNRCADDGDTCRSTTSTVNATIH